MRNGKPSGEFTALEGLAVLLAAIAIQICSETINQWGLYFYSPSEGGGRTIYVSIGIVGMIFVVATLWDAITDPLIGAWSDITRSRPGLARLVPVHGRRRPFIFWGSIALTFTSIAFWYPPVAAESPVNFWYGTVLLCLHWTFFTVTTVPLLALSPEIARSEAARVRLGVWFAVGMVLGLAVANALSGALVTLLDTASEGGATSPAGYRRLAAVYALVSLGLFQFYVWVVRERYDSGTAVHAHVPLLSGLRHAARNVPFLLYFVAFFLFSAGFLATQRALPYWAELGLSGNEGTVTILLGPFLLTCLASYAVIPWFARRLHVKWMMFAALAIISTGLPMTYPIAMLDVAPGLKVALGAALFAYCGIGQGIMYVMTTPMIGEIIDHDERCLSGRRQEALYNGLSGVAWKASMGVSIVLATQSMTWWGNSADNPLGVYLVGPIAGLCGLAGCAAMLFYPTGIGAGADRGRA
jgi:GPH family glycoside/pentoside/hexuronide:cation symporter